MADRKISELTQITGSDVDDANDEIAIVDASESETKAITREELFSGVGSASFDGNVTVDGNFTVNGTTTTINAQTLDVEDKNITVALGSPDAASADGAGLTVDGANATILYDSTDDTWDFNRGISTTGNVNGRDVAADGSKLDGVESNATADQTASEIKTAYESNADTNAFTDAEQTKLSSVESNADVTDTANVTAAGALMDSEVTNLEAVKAFDPTDYATSAQGDLADTAVQPNDSPTFGSVTVTGTVDGRDVAADGSKLDGIEANADVTDATNVTAAGALMDSELTDIASVKALDQGVATTDSPEFNGLTTTSINGGPLAGFRNAIINGNFAVNQRAVSGTVTLSAGGYGHDRWKAGSSGCTYTFATSENVTTITITAGSLVQVIEGENLFTDTYTLSFTGTAQGKIGAGSFGASGITGSVTGGTNLAIEFNTGTVAQVQLEPGSVATPFERRPVGTELALCQRYYQLGKLALGGSAAAGGNFFPSNVNFSTEMRASPSVVVSVTEENFNNSGGSFSFTTRNGTRFAAQSSASGIVSLVGVYAADSEL